MQATVEKNGKGCLTLLTEVTGQAVVQVLVELGTVSSLQPGAQTKVRQLHMTLETKHTLLELLKHTVMLKQYEPKFGIKIWRSHPQG